MWALVGFVVLIGMSCSLLSRGLENSGVEDEQLPPPTPTVEQGNLPMPLPPDAASIDASEGSFSYTTQLSVEEVANFYREALPPQGWTIEQQGDAGGTLMWSVSYQDTTYLLSIMPSNGMTIVTGGHIR